MLKDHELPLADVLQAKVCAIRAMAEATAAYRFENAKQLKHLRDALAVEQTALWARLAQAKELHQAITARVAEAVEIEDFDKAEEVYELQRLAEDCIKGFELDESQGGSADLTSGAISLGTASSLGLLEGDFTVEFWMRCHDVANQCPLLTGDPSSSGSFPSLYAKPGGGIQLDFAGGSSYSSRMRLQQTRRWTHVAFSFSFSATDNDFKVIIYQDGLQVEFGSEIWAINVDSEIRLGPFPGKLAEFRIWDHARAAEEVETWMSRRCKGDEPGLACCLSLRPARGLSDSTLDPEKALAAGHFFSDRGQWDGQITWDGDCPSQLLDPGVDLPYELVSECPICSIAFTEGSHYCRECGKKRPRKQVKPDTATISDPWSDQSLLRAWQWLDSSHETKVGERRRMVERRQLESETRQEGERQRKAYLEWQEQQRQQEEMEAKLKAEEVRPGSEVRLPIWKAAERVQEDERNLRSMTVSKVPGEPPHPQVPHRFGATMTFISTDTGMDTNLTMLTLGFFQRLFFDRGFTNMFAWAGNAMLSEYAGEHMVAGRSCQLWRYRAAIKKLQSSYHFNEITTQADCTIVDQTLLEKPSICDSVAPACENGRGAGPVTLDAFVFHPGISAADYNLEDQNVADLHGDALFICMDCLGNQTSFIDHNYTRISRYSLLVSPAFGQYALCNGYPDTSPPGPVCDGGDARLVGKEAPFFAGDGESRCAADSPIGFWYGLPKSGHCAPGEVPAKTASESGCTWSIIKRHKTINQTCLLNDHHYLSFCQADFKEGASFPRSQAALLAAFSSEDASQGGCPDIGGPDFQSEVTSLVV
ncbi:unnamed protein product [Symbiodinium pilosum]|uniref:LamG-like jellyroll fold domain-containing protein n=1 Tax=Symbiodinium pilosum TaxID=2952 RepID=A0A812MK81_SYMPI|nr:unnamed protein product [Symbiodinium pilosum]